MPQLTGAWEEKVTINFWNKYNNMIGLNKIVRIFKSAGYRKINGYINYSLL